MSKNTIYHAHGIGEAALDGLVTAKNRIGEARHRLMKQPPWPIPPIEVPPAPELPVIRGCGLKWHGNPNRSTTVLLAAYDGERAIVGSVRRDVLERLEPAEVLELTKRAERIADELEAEAAAREVKIKQAVAIALDDADPAIRALAERITAENQADREREAWVRQHGSARLRRLLEEGIEHYTVYRDERLAADRPGWRLPDYENWTSHEPRNAPMDALELLDEARKTAPDARLVYWQAIVPCDCEDEDDCYCETEYIWGYTCEADFLGRKIVYRIEDDGTPPVIVG